MKTLWSKNVFIGLLLVTNSITGASLFGAGPALASYFRAPPPTPVTKSAHRPRPHKQAIVSGGDFTPTTGMQACYERFLAGDPRVDEGALTVHWTVNSDGKVASIDLVKSELEDESLAGCITEKLKAMNFTPAEDQEGRLMAHRFNFRRRSPASVSF